MPLQKGKSKEAFSSNVKELMDSGKPQKQSLAIAYSMKQRNRKKMSTGGLADSKEDLEGSGDMQPDASSLDGDKDLSATESEAMASRVRTEDDDQWQQDPKEDHDIRENNERVNSFSNGGKIPDVREVEGERRMLNTSRDKQPAELSGSDFNRGQGSEGRQPMDPLGVATPGQIVDIIMGARKAAKFAKGGQVYEAGDAASITEPEDAWSGHGQDGNLKENYASDIDNDDLDQSLIGQILRDRKRKSNQR